MLRLISFFLFQFVCCLSFFILSLSFPYTIYLGLDSKVLPFTSIVIYAHSSCLSMVHGSFPFHLKLKNVYAGCSWIWARGSAENWSEIHVPKGICSEALTWWSTIPAGMPLGPPIISKGVLYGVHHSNLLCIDFQFVGYWT